VTSSLDITAPATLTVLASNGSLSSLEQIPPEGISIADPDASSRLTLTIVAGNTAAAFSASGTGGATITSNGGSNGATLTLSGTVFQVNTALASLELNEPGTATQDTLALTATDPAELQAQTDIAVNILPTTGPAFVAPPRTLTVTPNQPITIPLLLSDPAASGLAQMGLGQDETLSMTIAVGAGILLLPGWNDASGISAAGLGTGEIQLSFTPNDVPALNDLLAGLEFAGEGPGEALSYVLRNSSGVLPAAVTNGAVALEIGGKAAANGNYTFGSQTLLLGGETLAGTLAVTGTTAVLGNLSGAGAVDIAPDADLTLPDNNLFLSGTSLDFGALSANELVESGSLIIAGGASLSGQIYLNTGALVDFSGELVADGAEAQNFAQAISLAAGSQLIGSGTLQAGNFSESGLIEGPGTLTVESGQTLLVAAGIVSGVANLDVAPGGVMVLGPVSPLYGVFDATPLTIANSVLLNFLSNGGNVPVSGIYASMLGGDGGAFVINGPQVFSGTVTGFAAGDQLIFPGLSDFSLYNVTTGSFAIAGLDSDNNTVTYEIHASTPSGTQLVQGFDAEGDPDVVLRPITPSTAPAAANFVASAGVAQPLEGLDLQLIATSTHSLALTLAVSHGVIGTGSIAAAGTITLTASGLAAMDSLLAGLTYTGTGVSDVLTFTGNGILNGLFDEEDIGIAAPGSVNAGSTILFSEAQAASFALGSGLSIVTAPLAAGEDIVSGTIEFADAIQSNGLSGTALLVDDNATAIFNAAAQVALGADATLGDAGGAGTLVLDTSAFTTTGNVTLGTGSALDVLGALDAGGAINIASGALNLSGTLSAASASIGGTGTLNAYGNAVLGLTSLSDAGTLALDGASQASLASALIAGNLNLGGTARLDITGQLTQSGGIVQIGGDAALNAAAFVENLGSIADAGTISLTGALTDAGLFDLTGGTLVAPSVQINGGAFEGNGVLDAETIQNSGILIAEGGTLFASGSITGSGPIEIAASAALDIAGALSAGEAVTFLGPDAMLTLNDPSHPFGGVENMAGTDAIDIVGFAPSLVSDAGGEITVIDSIGSVISTFALAIAPGQPAVSIVSNNAGGSLITLGDELPCFARGTRLLTPHGYRAVEALKPGDPLITASGTRRPVCWIGRRTLDLGAQAAHNAQPILIQPGAFGPGLPAQQLRLSPLHGVYADGVLFPAAHLVNNATILRERGRAAMTYFHVELDRHDILLAEGLPCESYFDTGNRGALYHETGRRSPARRPFARRITNGPALAALRARLHAIALNAGFSLTYSPVLDAFAGGKRFRAQITQEGHRRIAQFSFPRKLRDVTLLAATACPADTDPHSQDRRELGVCLAPVEDILLGPGFYPRAPADIGVWMGRSAALRLRMPAARLSLPLAAVMQSWRTPGG
jgi:hypothetical protein